ncbi:MAG: 3-oxoacyl-ACP synthase, partial [Deltaproteobacteria bacterium]|nr:3-oxoacyl-ACP synthase [Deltaproteobacteria bacterium]MBW2530707.1 3-oxoacyl-ACP synthase [Deltaproteobacteria bacterium]
APIRAKVAAWATWRGEPEAAWASIPAPGTRCAVYSARPLDEAQLPPSWRQAPRRTAAPAAGDHESLGGFAAVAAVAALELEPLDSALLLGIAPDRGFALVLAPP